MPHRGTALASAPRHSGESDAQRTSRSTRNSRASSAPPSPPPCTIRRFSEALPRAYCSRSSSLTYYAPIVVSYYIISDLPAQHGFLLAAASAEWASRTRRRNLVSDRANGVPAATRGCASRGCGRVVPGITVPGWTVSRTMTRDVELRPCVRWMGGRDVLDPLSGGMTGSGTRDRSPGSEFRIRVKGARSRGRWRGRQGQERTLESRNREGLARYRLS